MITDYDLVRLLLPFSGADNVGGPFPDLSPDVRTVTGTSTARTSTAQSKYYGSSLSFNGTDSRVSVGISAYLFRFLWIPDSVWALDVWVRPQAAALPQTIFDTGARAVQRGCGLRITSSGALRYAVSNDGLIFEEYSAAGSIPNDEWSHVRVSSNLGNVVVAINGQAAISGTVPSFTSIFGNSTDIQIGSASVSGTPVDHFSGWMNDFVIHQGADLPVTDFTPPPAAAGTIVGTVRDDTGVGVARTVILVPRTSTRRLFNTTSASDGTYSRHVPATDFTRIVLDPATSPLPNDLVDRVVPS